MDGYFDGTLGSDPVHQDRPHHELDLSILEWGRQKGLRQTLLFNTIGQTSRPERGRCGSRQRRSRAHFQDLACSEREDDLTEMCIGAHVREGGVGFRERIGLVDGQAEFAGFHCWQQIGPHAAVDLADFFRAAGTEGDAVGRASA